jgi:phage terminase large subunit-like protein
MMSCVALVSDDADNIKPSKRKSSGRIDAIVALMMALYHANLSEMPEEPSIYEMDGERGGKLLTIDFD